MRYVLALLLAAGLLVGLGSTSQAMTPAPPLRYEVQPGDTLSAIATRYGVTVRDLVRVNRLVNPAPTSTAPPSFCPGAISWDEASQYVGTQKSVKGPVASTNYAPRSNNQPTFLNLGQPYPNHKFTVVIWGRNRANFSGAPEQTYRGQFICVTGLIETYQGKPQIEATTPS